MIGMLRRCALATWIAALPFPTWCAEIDPTALIEQCAPRVDVGTMGAIVRTESSGHMFVLSDDGPRGLPWSKRKSLIRSIYPGTREEAAEIARQLIAAGHLVGIGLTQVSSQHIPALGISVEQLLDPCTNISTGAGILRSLFDRARASRRYRNEDEALGAAVSAYNTGSFTDGFANGYVQKVLANMRSGPPSLWAKPLASLGARSSKPGRSKTYAADNRSQRVSARESSLDVAFE